MQRPTRIVIFGIFALIIGTLSGITNAAEAFFALMGPGFLEQMRTMMQQMGQELSTTQQQNLQVQISSLGKPVFRVGQAIESSATAVMAAVLIVAGIGLLAGRSWSLKPAKWWAIYAIPAAVVSVLLNAKYVWPEMPDSPTGVIGVLFTLGMLTVLWAFPILVLRALPTEQVKAYLAWRDQQRNAPEPMPTPPSAPIQQPTEQATPTPPATPPVPTPAAPTPTPHQSSAAEQTWRNDPWNDPSSK